MGIYDREYYRREGPSFLGSLANQGAVVKWLVGINIGVPASMAWFPFNGWNESFFGDLHMQGKEGVQFFTQQKVTTTRWFSFGEGDIWHREAK